MSKLSVGIIGAAGAVGGELLKGLHDRNFPLKELRLFATQRSAGQKLHFGDDQLEVEAFTEDRLRGLDLVFVAAGTGASLELAPLAVRAGAVVIDKSNAFRMDPKVPLVVPEVNPEALDHHSGIIASPNCSTIQLVVALNPLYRSFGIRRLIVSTYQSVSGTGVDAMRELEQQSADVLQGRSPEAKVYPHRIAFNYLPHIDDFEPNGYTLEEMKVVRETRKILGDEGLLISCTAVRVPVMVSHGESVVVELERECSVEEARRLWSEAPGVRVMDDPSAAVYPTAIHAAGQDDVLVGRIRADLALPQALHFWVVADNLRKGAATNAIQVAETLRKRSLL